VTGEMDEMNNRKDGIVIIAEVEKLYPNEWLLFEVVETDEQNQPIRGRLLAHDPDHDAVVRVLLETDCAHTYHYYNGEPIPAILL
jgi:hypothetical protein